MCGKTDEKSPDEKFFLSAAEWAAGAAGPLLLWRSSAEIAQRMIYHDTKGTAAAARPLATAACHTWLKSCDGLV